MRGLLTCCVRVIACLSLASATLADEQGKVYFKSYDFGKSEVIYAMQPFWKNEIVYAVCEGSASDKNCKVFVESTDRDENTVQSCDLNLTYSGQVSYGVILTNAGNSRAILAVRDGETKIKLISVNVNGCRINEAIIDVTRESLQRFYSSCLIVPRENNYDVIYRNRELCGELTCKSTFDYEGKLIKAASTFPLRSLEVWWSQIQYGNNAYLVAESGQATEVYLIKDEDPQNKITLFTGTREQLLELVTGLSVEEKKFGICAYYSFSDPKVVCRQYDVEGKTKIMEIEIDNKARVILYLDLLNLEEGFLVALLLKPKGPESNSVAVTRFDEYGKEGKTVIVDPKCEEKIVIAKLFKNTNGQYCVNSMCMTTLFDTNKSSSKFSRTTRCFRNTELF